LVRRGIEYPFSLYGKGSSLAASTREPPMAVVHHHDLPAHETNRCATMFCLTWLGFFALLGVATYLISLI